MLTSDKELNNIKVHTQYSICEGAVKIEQLNEVTLKVAHIKLLSIVVYRENS